MSNIKISELPFASLASASALIPIVQNGATYATYASNVTNSTTSSYAVSASYSTSAASLGTYKSYVALVTHGSGGFTTIELQNDLGVTPTWSNPSNGLLWVDATGAFTIDKTVLFSTQIRHGGQPYFVVGNAWFNADRIQYDIHLYSGTQTGTPYFDNVPFEIRVYK